MIDAVLVVAVYDVISDRRRRRLFKLLRRYGVPVQKSAFEGRLTARERDRLQREAAQLLDASQDRFTLYPIAAPQEKGITHVGPERPTCDNPAYYLI